MTALSGALLALGTAAVAIAASGDPPPPSGQKPAVNKPEALPAQGVARLATAERGVASSDFVAARLAEAARSIGATRTDTARVAREWNGRRIHVARAGEGACLAVENESSGRVTATCTTADGLPQGALWLVVAGSGQAKEVFGVAPDGVDEVLLTLDDGQNRRLSVERNTYSATVGASLARVEWIASDGGRADLRLPSRR
ncbi:MAG TPA: hypothetical protein VF587_05140 [Solirubrobacteraceae bacterium]|jgi:hypothetical protein